MNENTRKKFGLHYEFIPDYTILAQSTFDLEPIVALGNLIKVKAIASGREFVLGECNVVLTNPKYNETQYKIDEYEALKAEKSNQVKNTLLMGALGIIGFILFITVAKTIK